MNGISDLKIEIGHLNQTIGKGNAKQGFSKELAIALDGLNKSKSSGNPSQQDPVSQIPLNGDITKFYPDADIKYAFVSLPDPRVPRHQRTFENSLDSITSGFSKNNYTLQLQKN